jgi:hypothetical protein
MAAALVEDRSPVEIGEDQGVVEHQQATGKRMRELAGVEVVRCGLSTGGWCTAGEEADGGGGIQLEHWNLDAESNRIASGSVCSATACEREEVKALRRAGHDGEEVAAGEGSGTSWHARVRPGGERKEVKTGRGGRVDKFCSWRWRSGRGIDGERRWQERRRRRKRRAPEEDEAGGVRRTNS